MPRRAKGQGQGGQVQINGSSANAAAIQASRVQAAPVQVAPVQAVPIQAAPVNLIRDRSTLVSTGRILRSNPLMRNTVDMDSHEPLVVPTDPLLKQAYMEAGLEVSDSAWQRRKRLAESNGRSDLHRRLTLKENAGVAPNIQRENITLKQAVLLSDRDLVERYGRYQANSKYLSARYGLIKNKYYTLLPEKIMKTMPRDEIMSKLRELYKEDAANRNEELIRYYQSIIIIRDTEEAAKQKRQGSVPNHTLPSSTKLREQNNSAYQRNLAAMANDSILGVQETRERTSAMESVMVPSSKQRSWRGNDASLTDAKREGMREVLAFMYRNCCKSSESMEPFVYKLTQAKNEQLLTMFYLIEKDKMSAPSTEDYYTAITDYVPDVKAIKDRVVASRWKFWKRVGKDHSDDVINWGLISDAARFAMGEDVLEKHVEYKGQIDAIEQELNAPGQKSDEEKRDSLYALIRAKGNLLLTMYRGAGLSPDMPVELIRDLKLRQRVMLLLDEFKEDTKKLVQLIQRVGLGRAENNDNAGKYAESKKKAKDVEQREEESRFDETMTNLISSVDTVRTTDGVVDSLSFIEKVGDFSEKAGYMGSIGGLSVVSSVLGIIASIGSAYNIAKGAEALSVADHVSQGIGVTGAMIDGVNSFVKGTSDLIGSFVNLGETGQATWLVQDTVVRTAGTAFSTVAGGIQFCTGCVSMFAGALQTTSGAIQHRRAISSEEDVQRSREKLNTKAQPLTQEQESLRQFLDHQDRAVADQKFSAGVSIASGTLKMVGGALTVSGILAPIGGILTVAGSIVDIGLGVLYARHRKKKTRQAAVDDSLKIDLAMKEVRKRSDLARRMDDDRLRRAVRQEALGELGYTSYKEFFANLSKQNALMLYKHVFEMPDTDPDYKMYLDALKSVGTKIRIPQNPGEKPFPTPEVIYSKLME